MTKQYEEAQATLDNLATTAQKGSTDLLAKASQMPFSTPAELAKEARDIRETYETLKSIPRDDPNWNATFELLKAKLDAWASVKRANFSAEEIHTSAERYHGEIVRLINLRNQGSNQAVVGVDEGSNKLANVGTSNANLPQAGDAPSNVNVPGGAHQFWGSNDHSSLGFIQDWMNSFSQEQKGIFAIITLLIMIVGCVFDIFLLIYIDQLVDKYQLGIKYPKLTKWIKYRKTFMNTYILYNFFIILFIITFLIVELLLIYFF